MALGTGRKRVRIHAGLFRPVSVAVQETTGMVFCGDICFVCWFVSFCLKQVLPMEPLLTWNSICKLDWL